MNIASDLRHLSLIDVLQSRAASAAPAFTFMADGDNVTAALSFSELDRRARHLAAHLQHRARPRDRILLVYPPGIDYIVAFFGCAYAGMIAVPALPPANARTLPRLLAIARDAQPALALAPAALVAKMERMQAAGDGTLGCLDWCAADGLPDAADAWRHPVPRPEDVLFLQYTSGSTGTPKGVMVSHANVLANLALMNGAFPMTSDDTIVSWLPPHHDMGLVSTILLPVCAGSHAVQFPPAAFVAQPLRWLKALSTWRARFSAAPNLAYDLCVERIGAEHKAGLDLSAWAHAINGAEPVRPRSLRRFVEAFAPCGFRAEALRPAYGLAESTLFVSSGRGAATLAVDKAALAAGDIVPATGPQEPIELVPLGSPRAAGYRWSIVDPATRAPLGPGKVGEIWVAGASVAAGYWQRNDAAFGAVTADGKGPWLRTGDAGFEHGGQLYVSGRIKDVMIFGGRNIYPQDVEHTVERVHPAFRQNGCAAFALEDDGPTRLVLLQEVSARRHVDLAHVMDKLRAAVREQHGIARIAAVLLLRVGHIPRTSSGKLARRRCRQLYLDGAFDPLDAWHAGTSDAAPCAPVALTIDADAPCQGKQRHEDVEPEACIGPSVDYPREALLHQLVEAQAAARPLAVAAQYEERTLTYGELNRRANHVAHRLIAQGVGPDDLVALCVERGLKMVIGVLAILKAGAAWVPIDPALPEERIAFMLEDCAPAAVLMRDTLVDDNAWPDENPAVPGLTARHLACVLYSPGATGRPQGVMLQHDGIVNRLLWARDAFDVGRADRVLQQTPFGFGAAVWEIFLPLLAGGRVVLARPDGHQDPEYLARLMTATSITIAHFTPSMLALFLELAGGAPCPALRHVLCGGAPLPGALRQRCAALQPGAAMHNLYGPAEASLDVTAWRCDGGADAEEEQAQEPLGRPIANMRIHLLDGQLRPVPVGATGELHIGGIGVARGYLHRPELTARRFIDSPHGRLFKTGDLGRRRPDGALEYVGRNDAQVTIRGVPIEPAEIEVCLAACPGVRQAVVIAREQAGGGKRLIGYVRADAAVQPQALRARLADQLPDYMVPAALVVLDAFPLTPNGQPDRGRLPDPPRGGGVPFVAPRTETEHTIARLWMDVLHVDEAGIHDDFRAAGGDSLSAARLLTQLRTALPGRQFGLPDLYRAPTIAALAALADGAPPREHALLEALLPAADDTTPTLVCCPYAGAGAAMYRPLADALARAGARVALYAVAVPGNEPGARPGTGAAALDSIEALAGACVRAIQAQVRGPVALYGHCIGSNLALEITHRLELAGRKVHLLAVGGALPATMEDKLLMEQDIWAGVNDADIHALIRSWSGAAEPVRADALAFVIANFKKDARMASRYEYGRGDWTVRAPLHALFGSADPLTPDFETRYLRWLEVADAVHLGVVDGGRHHFVGDQPDAVADILLRALGATVTEGAAP
ncbi:amino acid adenylation domain-containing protein [Pseudoduganella flava]|uniref:Amino acid adenylation domain-containing protein n=1 Tax=Pseudoduganella flava TaxID=871742 RepID=A0A562PL62_9BURK|nr:amino acid adenylation domain-containing protein [Pseudoduganella flava]QGZ42390.1 amino acid adenylation domain-containing protein [Pseudoduganella flava]TWI44950.1 amino acid adenylation domain-containing protein [Pseudoduganella flava]